MARKISVRTVVNRRALDAIRAGAVDGLEAMALAILDRTRPPDDPTTAATIQGDYGIWADGRKVAGGASRPHGLRVKNGITLIVGYGFPARFNEIGTSHQPARPFFTPEVLAVIPGTEGFLRPKIADQARRVR